MQAISGSLAFGMTDRIDPPRCGSCAGAVLKSALSVSTRASASLKQVKEANGVGHMF
jgi:hypothetical protein